MAPTFERILVAVDESPAAQTAVATAIDLAAADSASIIFVHVVSVLGEQLVPAAKEPERVPSPATTELLQDAAAEAADAGVASSTELLVGYPPRQVALLADELDVDLIVVGCRQLHGLRRLILGSTSRQLLSETRRPVLVVPAGVEVEAVAAAAGAGGAREAGHQEGASS